MSREPTKNDKQYWFRAKRYGSGWGLPCSWQGWLFFIPWAVILFYVAVNLMPHRPWLGVAALALMAALLVGVCYWKGEPDGRLKKR